VSIVVAFTYVIAHNSLHFILVHNVASTLLHKAQLATEIIFFEYLLVWHVEYQIQLHYQGIKELWAASIKDFSSACAFV
jgi:hypothetical protein